MALYNLAGFKTGTLGTADVVFSAPVTALNTFPLAGVPNGATVTYMLENFDGAGSVDAREVGRGVWDSGTLTLARTTVADSTNGGAKIVLGGTAEARITAIAQDFSAAAVGAPALVSPSVAGNFVSFSGVSGGQADSGFSGASFQPIDATLTSIAALGSAADRMIYTTALDTWAEATLTAFARTFLDDANAAAVRSTLGLGAAALLAVPITAANGGTGIANGASATLTLPNLAITLGGGGAAQTYTLPAAGGTFALLNAANVFTTSQMIDMGADAIELRLQAHSTKTTSYLTLENSSATVLTSFNQLGYLSVGANVDVAGTAHGIRSTLVSTGASQFGIRGTMRPATNSSTLGGIQAELIFNNTVTYTSTGSGAQSALVCMMTVGPSNAIISQMNGWTVQGNQTAGTITNLSYILVTDLPKSAGTRTTQYGIRILDLANAGTNIALETNAGSVVFNNGGAADGDLTWKTDSYNGIFGDASNESIVIMSNAAGKVGFYGATAVIQPAGANQAALTNSTGGTYNGTLIDVGALFSQANINDNFTDIFTLLNEIRTALVNSGLIKGAA